jgi:toxin ParE1/3/4
MKQQPYVLSKKAISDLEQIWVYTAKKGSIEQADRYYGLIIDEINFLCRNPESGKSIENVRKGYKVSKMKSHVIFYRVKEERIEIIRILHECMDVDTRLSD